MEQEYNTDLVLITNSYPFGAVAESFLDKEIPFLSQFFEKVTIVPLSYPSEVERVTRELPNNIFCDTSFIEQKNLEKNNGSKIKYFSMKHFYSELFHKPVSLYDKISRKKMLDSLHLSLQLEKWLNKYLKNNTLNLKRTVFYTYWLTWATMGVSLTKSKFRDIKLVSRAHGYDLYEERYSSPYIPFRLPALSKLEKLYLISQHGKNYITEKYPKLKNKVEVSNLGVTSQKTLSETSKDGAFRLLSCSYIVPVKRIELIVQGLSLLGRKRPELNVIWTHIGYGANKEEIEKLASDILPDNIQTNFMGLLKNSEVLTYYRDNPVDVFINVSSSEGIPVSIMEAQSFGVPAIAPMVGGIPEILSNSCGILLKENPSTLEILEAIEFFINNPNEAKKNED
ncbi:glycosyltransferase [Candidatus Bathyarchaeota archaeon]|nr:glycosyltransferase [Candidatus Bathyarchaeota archaeon]